MVRDRAVPCPLPPATQHPPQGPQLCAPPHLQGHQRGLRTGVRGHRVTVGAPSQTWGHRPRSGEEPETPLGFHARTPHAWAPCWALRSGWSRPSGNGAHSRRAHASPRLPTHSPRLPAAGTRRTGDGRQCDRQQEVQAANAPPAWGLGSHHRRRARRNRGGTCLLSGSFAQGGSVGRPRLHPQTVSDTTPATHPPAQHRVSQSWARAESQVGEE